MRHRATAFVVGLCVWAWSGALPQALAQVPSVGPSGCVALCPGGSPVSSHRRDPQSRAASPRPSGPSREQIERLRHLEELQRKAFRELEIDIARARESQASPGLVGIELPQHIVYGRDARGREVHQIGPAQVFARYGIEPKKPTGYPEGGYPGESASRKRLGQALAILALLFSRSPSGGWELDAEGRPKWKNVSMEDAWFLANEAGFAMEGRPLHVAVQGGSVPHLTDSQLAKVKVELDKIARAEKTLGEHRDRSRQILRDVAALSRRKPTTPTKDRPTIDEESRKLAEKYAKAFELEEATRQELKKSEAKLGKIIVHVVE